MRTIIATLTFILVALLSPMALRAQHIPEEVRIKQYVNKYHPSAVPQANGLYLIKLTEGQGPQAKPKKNVTVHYEGKLLNLQVFDSSYDRGEPITFKLGEGIVIEGWDKAIVQMREGDVAVIIIPSQLGYGDRALSRIPANSPLVFKIEIVKAEQ